MKLINFKSPPDRNVEGGFLFWFDVCTPTEKVGQQIVKQVSANCHNWWR